MEKDCTTKNKKKKIQLLTIIILFADYHYAKVENNLFSELYRQLIFSEVARYTRSFQKVTGIFILGRLY